MHTKRALIVVAFALVTALSCNLVAAQNIESKPASFFGGEITLPAGYKTEHLTGPDFDVDYVIPEGTTANTANAMFGIYSGSNSNFDPPKTGVREEAGSFAGKSFKWKVWQTNVQGKSGYQYQALIKFDGDNAVWHLFVVAPELQQIEELMQVVKSYQIKPTR